jgi:hypothetical protein
MATVQQWCVRATLGITLALSGACQHPTSADEAVDIDEILVTTVTPEVASADAANDGKTYRVVRGNNQPDEILVYDWHTAFTIGFRFTDLADDDDYLEFPVDITSATIKVQQASGGIVTTPTGGEVEHYEFVSAASGNRFAAIGATTELRLDVWYDLPSLRKEALITVTVSFVDNDGATITKNVEVRVAP